MCGASQQRLMGEDASYLQLMNNDMQPYLLCALWHRTGHEYALLDFTIWVKLAPSRAMELSNSHQTYLP